MLQYFLPNGPDCLFEPGFVGKMMEDISYSRVSPEAYIIVFGFFGLCIGVVGVGMLLKIRWRSEDLAPLSYIDRRSDMLEILSLAVTQRSKLRVSFHHDGQGSRSTDATIVEVRKDSILIEMSSVVSLNRNWTGRYLECDFRVRGGKKQSHQDFFFFVCQITDVSKSGSEVLLVTASFPLRLEFKQKRLHLRIKPPEKYIPFFALWTEEMVKNAGGRVNDPKTWGQSALEFEAEEIKPISIENISSGGMRLDVPTAAMRKMPHKFALGQRYLIRLGLFEPEEQNTLTYYLLSRVQNLVDDTGISGKQEVGLRFLGIGIFTERANGFLEWHVVGEQLGAHEVDEWVFKRHLEFYRSKGAE